MFKGPEEIQPNKTEPIEKQPIQKEETVRPEDKESYEEKYAQVLYRKNELYENSVNKDPSKEPIKSALEVHEKIVMDYGNKLIEAHNLTPEQKVSARIALMLHDSGKLDSSLLEHHEQGVKNAEVMLNQLEGQKIEGIEITDEIKEKVKEAIERHMNHPFLVMLNKGEQFPVPKDDIDKIVFDADMMANIGFKNVAFRLANEKFMGEDAKKSLENNSTVLEETFKNVMQGVRQMENTVLSDPAKKMAGGLVDSAEKIYKYLKESNIFEKIQNEFSNEKGEYNMGTINEMGDKEVSGVNLMKKRLNEEIQKAGLALKDVDDNTVKNFIM